MSIDLRSFFAHYADRYMARDVDAVTDLYDAPFLAVRGGSAIHLGDRVAVAEHLTGLMDAYRKAGAAQAEIIDLDVLEQGDGAALATVRWNVLSAAGDLIRDFRTSYQLVGPEPWRIVSYVNHDAVARTPVT